MEANIFVLRDSNRNREYIRSKELNDFFYFETLPYKGKSIPI